MPVIGPAWLVRISKLVPTFGSKPTTKLKVLLERETAPEATRWEYSLPGVGPSRRKRRVVEEKKLTGPIDRQNPGAVDGTGGHDTPERGDGIERPFTTQKPTSDTDGAGDGHRSRGACEDTARHLQAAGERLRRRAGQVGASCDRC